MPLSAQTTEWSHCEVQPAVVSSAPVQKSLGDEPDLLYLNADRADLQRGQTSVLHGNATARKGLQRLEADRLRLHEPSNRLDAAGNVRYRQPSLEIDGDRARLNMKTDEALIDRAEYRLLDRHARGDASEVRVTGNERVRAERGRYTTCEPGSDHWVLEATSIDIDRTSDVGTARNVQVRFMDVPIFYSPYLTFPTSDKRKSGFLLPRVRVSGETGFDYLQPYYWNIAPNRDATLSLRAMSKRGALLESEYRYLQPQSGGTLGLEYLPYDFNEDKARGAVSYQHLGLYQQRWLADVDANYVSDKDYLEDLGTGLEIASTQFVDQRADLTYLGNGWSLLGRVQDYQTVDRDVDADERPYTRLPMLLLTRALPERSGQVNFGFRGEAVYFDRRASVTGTRVDLTPKVSYPLRNPWGFLIPRASFRFTQYNLQDLEPGVARSPTRALPALSLDAGTFFDRSISLGGRRFLQTVEPRLFYLYRPFDDQDDIPVFDTGTFTFNFNELFRDDRFNGADRLGDANQMTLALTTRLLDHDTGGERLRASIGSIGYFRNRKVTLPDSIRERDNVSDIIAEVSTTLNPAWRLGGAIQFDPDDERTERGHATIQYRPRDDRVLNLSFRRLRGAVEQVDATTRWQVNKAWSLLGRFNYSLEEDRNLESFLGLEYEDCCWAIRFGGRRYLRNSDGDQTNAVFVQLSLKGLADIGDRSARSFAARIPGYQNQF